MFKPGTLEEASSLIGDLFFIVMILWIGLPHYQAAWITIFLVFIIRMFAIRYNIQSRSLHAFQQYWQGDDHTSPASRAEEGKQP